MQDRGGGVLKIPLDVLKGWLLRELDSFTSLHFTLTGIWRELSFQRLNPIFPRPFPAEC